MNEITVIKQNHLGEEVYRWKGKLLERSDTVVQVEAAFRLSGQGRPSQEPTFLGDVSLHTGDSFIETYYSDRWYNYYEIHDQASDLVKCWYCNVTYPANFGNDIILFRDLALDLLVYPDGRQVVLDEDEFTALNISTEDKMRALAALEELKTQFRERLE